MIERVDPLRDAGRIGVHQQLEPKRARRRVPEGDHLAEFPRGIHVQQRKRQLRGIKRLARQMQQNRGVLADRIQQHGLAAFRRHLAHDLDALILQPPEVKMGGRRQGRIHSHLVFRPRARVQKDLLCGPRTPLPGGTVLLLLRPSSVQAGQKRANFALWRKYPMALTRRAALAASAVTVFAIGRARAADTLKIGQVAPLTGPAAELGRYQVNGAKQAADAINEKGGVLGQQIELVVEDDQTTNPGAVLAFSRLVNRGDCAAYIGSIRSTQVHAMAPDMLKAAKVMMFGGTDPTLTQMGNPWMFRCRPNDSYSAKVIAEFGVKSLEKKKWAIVHSTDAFGTNGMKALVDSLDKAGIKPELVQGYTNQASDFTPVVLAVKQSGADVIVSYFTFETDLAVFARQPSSSA